VSLMRRYLFLILAACVAFAIGIAVGNGPLQKDDGNDTASLKSDRASLEDRVSDLEGADVFDDAVSKALAGGLLKDKLSGRSVTVLVLPGVSDSVVTASTAVLTRAGAELPAVVRLNTDLLDPAKKTYVASVTTSSLKGADDLAALTKAGTYERLGALLARAYVGTPDNDVFDPEATKIDSELQGAKLTSLDDEPARRGNLVVVLADDEHGDTSLSTARVVIAHDIVSALTSQSQAVVVAAPPASSTRGGLIAELSADEALGGQLSTINVLDSTTGRTALVYALRAAAAGVPGHFGVDGGEAVLPPGLAEQDQ
jgi:hypothetical protein